MKKALSILIISFLVIATSQSKAQVLATSMRITVLSSMGNLVENAKVTVYANQEDYENEENAVAGPAFTDAKGRVTFKNLDEKEYYVQVISGDKNNYGDAERTGKLIKGKLNKFNIVIQ
ncbi:MAG: carboxypeptidase regulatory-like domain-containing protein [Cyclobacteriaceae bacterium]|nr:carboxypeptidase regulatory-like domain-containing protein [Cyclobacteriaceae bacterium]